MSTEQPIILVVTARPRPEHLEQACSILVEAAPEVHREQGCQLYAHHKKADGALVTIEKWASQQALIAHAHSPATVQMTQRLEPLLEGPVDVAVLDALPSGDPSRGVL